MNPEQLLVSQQLVIRNISSSLAAMEKSANALSPTAHTSYRYKAANPTPFSGVPDTQALNPPRGRLPLAGVNW
jgi:hypothetical protein